jgi:hypothetical protein
MYITEARDYFPSRHYEVPKRKEKRLEKLFAGGRHPGKLFESDVRTGIIVRFNLQRGAEHLEDRGRSHEL